MTSWGRSLGGFPERWQDQFNWLGTRDPAPFLAVPAAIEFLEQTGLENFRDIDASTWRNRRVQKLEQHFGQTAWIPDSIGLVRFDDRRSASPQRLQEAETEFDASIATGVARTISNRGSDHGMLRPAVLARLMPSLQYVRRHRLSCGRIEGGTVSVLKAENTSVRFRTISSEWRRSRPSVLATSFHTLDCWMQIERVLGSRLNLSGSV